VGRIALSVAGIALVASAAFSIGEVHGRQTHRPNAPATVSTGLAGLSVSGLERLQNQLKQAGTGGTSAELSQLEQQLGISPTASPATQAEQLRAELNAINACLGGSPTPGVC
jgi:hypothetical protein